MGGIQWRENSLQLASHQNSISGKGQRKKKKKKKGDQHMA